MNLKKILTKKNFKAWLESKASTTKVGKAIDAYACPIFNFLKQNNIPVTFVGKVWGIKLNGSDSYIDIPKWTERFIDTLDKSMADGASVSAKKALEILQKS